MEEGFSTVWFLHNETVEGKGAIARQREKKEITKVLLMGHFFGCSVKVQ